MLLNLLNADSYIGTLVAGSIQSPAELAETRRFNTYFPRKLVCFAGEHLTIAKIRALLRPGFQSLLF